MIRILFKQRLADKEFQDKRRITMDEVCEKTGIARATLTRIANVPGYNTNTQTIDRLCTYFDCGPEELLEHIDD